MPTYELGRPLRQNGFFAAQSMSTDSLTGVHAVG